MRCCGGGIASHLSRMEAGLRVQHLEGGAVYRDTVCSVIHPAARFLPLWLLCCSRCDALGLGEYGHSSSRRYIAYCRLAPSYFVSVHYSRDPQVARDSLRKLLGGREPVIAALHAGLECGVIGDKAPGMDMVRTICFSHFWDMAYSRMGSRDKICPTQSCFPQCASHHWLLFDFFFSRGCNPAQTCRL